MTSKIPRYLLVYTTLKKQIENFDYPIGGNLPPEPLLEKQFNVSRTTVRKAVEILAEQGFVSIQQGRGTKVLDFKATQKLQYVTSFSETLKEQGFAVEHRIRSVETVRPPKIIAEKLKAGGSDLTVRISRTTLANGIPIALLTNYLQPGLAPEIEKNLDGLESLYQLLEHRYHIFIDAATDYISAATASPEEARLLKITTAEPLLVVRRISYRSGEPIEFADLRIIAERYEYSVHTKDRPPREVHF